MNLQFPSRVHSLLPLIITNDLDQKNVLYEGRFHILLKSAKAVPFLPSVSVCSAEVRQDSPVPSAETDSG